MAKPDFTRLPVPLTCKELRLVGRFRQLDAVAQAVAVQMVEDALDEQRHNPLQALLARLSRD